MQSILRPTSISRLAPSSSSGKGQLGIMDKDEVGRPPENADSARLVAADTIHSRYSWGRGSCLLRLEQLS